MGKLRIWLFLISVTTSLVGAYAASGDQERLVTEEEWKAFFLDSRATKNEIEKAQKKYESLSTVMHTDLSLLSNENLEKIGIHAPGDKRCALHVFVNDDRDSLVLRQTVLDPNGDFTVKETPLFVLQQGSIKGVAGRDYKYDKDLDAYYPLKIVVNIDSGEHRKEMLACIGMPNIIAIERMKEETFFNLTEGVFSTASIADWKTDDLQHQRTFNALLYAGLLQGRVKKVTFTMGSFEEEEKPLRRQKAVSDLLALEAACGDDAGAFSSGQRRESTSSLASTGSINSKNLDRKANFLSSFCVLFLAALFIQGAGQA